MTTTLDPEVCRFFDAMIREFETHELCKHWKGRDRSGNVTSVMSHHCTSLCIYGCMDRVIALHDMQSLEFAATRLLEQAIGTTSLALAFNDLPSTTKADVIAKIKEAKALAGCTQT